MKLELDLNDEAGLARLEAELQSALDVVRHARLRATSTKPPIRTESNGRHSRETVLSPIAKQRENLEGLAKELFDNLPQQFTVADLLKHPDVDRYRAKNLISKWEKRKQTVLVQKSTGGSHPNVYAKNKG